MGFVIFSLVDLMNELRLLWCVCCVCIYIYVRMRLRVRVYVSVFAASLRTLPLTHFILALIFV